MILPIPVPVLPNLEVPTLAETQRTAEGLACIVRPPSGLTDLQRLLIEALTSAMTGHTVSVTGDERHTVEATAAHFASRTAAFRERMVQLALLGSLVLRPLPSVVVDQVKDFSRWLGVDDGMIDVAGRFAEGSLGLAAVDFARNGYTSTWSTESHEALHLSTQLAEAWDTAVADPALAERWAALGELPDGTLGRRVWELYRARGFAFPGGPGSAPPLLAQHDWVHVLADFGTTVESELEVFAFIARANDDPLAFSLLAMVISLFETGYLRTGAGLFEASTGHLERAGVVTRMADAMRRGALCHDAVTDRDSIDFLGLDWFELAALPVSEARARFNVVAKSAPADEAGSVGPWEPGGISPFQQAAGRAAADREGRAYDAYGASAAD